MHHLRTKHGLKAVGMDRSWRMLNTAIHRHAQIPGCLAQADGNDLSFDSGSLDGIRSRAEIDGMIRDAGFYIRMWQEQTYHLTQLAADMIFT